MQGEEAEAYRFYYETGDAIRDQAMIAIQNKALLKAVLTLQRRIMDILDPGGDAEELVNDTIRTEQLKELANLASRHPGVAVSLEQFINSDK